MPIIIYFIFDCTYFKRNSPHNPRNTFVQYMHKRLAQNAKLDKQIVSLDLFEIFTQIS